MSELSILKLCNEDENKENFTSNIRSTAGVSTKYEQVIVDYEWLDLMEDTIRYLDNILRNPNRFIVNEEEIVKIELARRVTVESIRHLSKHTNFIQKIEDNGDVKPSKILNINKDESYDTYENRLIYTLIENMKNFVEIKKKEKFTSSQIKDIKKLEYHGKSKVGKRKANISIMLDTNLTDTSDGGTLNNESVEQRIEKLEQNITMLQNTDVYKDLRKKHVERVIKNIKDEDCTEICKKIDSARNIFIYGVGMVQSSIKKELKRIFMTAGKILYDLSGYKESEISLSMANSDDLFIIISVSGENDFIIDFASKLKVRNIPILSITKMKENTLAQMSDYNLYISSVTFLDTLKDVSYDSVTSYFILVEILFFKYIEYLKEKGE